MSLFVKVYTNFYTHRKTLRLRAALGDDAFWVPPRLWAYAAEHQPDGDFSGYTDAEVAMLVGYTKDATSMLQALLRAGFMDASRKIHDWDEHNSYHGNYAERAKKAAIARWNKAKGAAGAPPPAPPLTDKDRIGEERSIPPSNATSIGQPVLGLTGLPAVEAPKQYPKTIPPAIQDVKSMAKDIDLPELEADQFWNFYASKGWKVGRESMKDWQCALRGWKARFVKGQAAIGQVNGHTRQVTQDKPINIHNIRPEDCI